jgi:hypothetical protein
MSYQSKYRNRNLNLKTTAKRSTSNGKFKVFRKLSAQEVVALGTAHPDDWYIADTQNDFATENAKTFGVSKFKVLVCYDVQEDKETGQFTTTKLDEKKRYELRTKFNNTKTKSQVKPAEQAKKQNKYNEQRFSTRMGISDFKLSKEDLDDKLTDLAVMEVKRLEQHMGEMDPEQFDEWVENEKKVLENRHTVWYAQYLIDKRYQDIVADEKDGNIIDMFNVPTTGDSIKSFVVYDRKFNAEFDDIKFKPTRGESEYSVPLDEPMVYHTVSGNQETDELWGKYRQLVEGPDGKPTTQNPLIENEDGKKQPLNTRNIGQWLIPNSVANITEKYHICIHSKGISLKSNITDLIAKIPAFRMSYGNDNNEDLEELNMGVGVFKSSSTISVEPDNNNDNIEIIEGENIEMDGLIQQVNAMAADDD